MAAEDPGRGATSIEAEGRTVVLPPRLASQNPLDDPCDLVAIADAKK
jgi:hypothetical protein